MMIYSQDLIPSSKLKYSVIPKGYNCVLDTSIAITSLVSEDDEKLVRYSIKCSRENTARCFVIVIDK